jgi:hypothetical protein
MMGLGLLAAAGLSQCQPACTPIPDGDPVAENAPPPVEVVPAPVDTLAPVTVPPVTPPTTKPTPPIDQFDGGIVFAQLSCNDSILLGAEASAPAEYDTVTFRTVIVNNTSASNTPALNLPHDFTFALPSPSTVFEVVSGPFVTGGFYVVAGTAANQWFPMTFHDNDGLVADVTVNAPGPHAVTVPPCH